MENLNFIFRCQTLKVYTTNKANNTFNDIYFDFGGKWGLVFHVN